MSHCAITALHVPLEPDEQEVWLQGSDLEDYSLELPLISLGQVFTTILVVLAFVILLDNSTGAIAKLFSPFKRMREENKAGIDAVRAELETYKVEMEKIQDENDQTIADWRAARMSMIGSTGRTWTGLPL